MNDSRSFFASAASWIREIFGAIPREISQAINEMDTVLEGVTIPNNADNDGNVNLVDSYDESDITTYPLSKYVTYLVGQQPKLPTFDTFMDLAKKIVAAEDAGATPPPPPCVDTPVEPEAVGATIACINAVRGEGGMFDVAAKTVVGQAHQAAERVINARKAAAIRVALEWCGEHRSALAAKRRQVEAMRGVMALQAAERERHDAAMGHQNVEVSIMEFLTLIKGLLTPENQALAVNALRGLGHIEAVQIVEPVSQ